MTMTQQKVQEALSALHKAEKDHQPVAILVKLYQAVLAAYGGRLA